MRDERVHRAMSVWTIVTLLVTTFDVSAGHVRGQTPAMSVLDAGVTVSVP